jgi:hypothetical protein
MTNPATCPYSHRLRSRIQTAGTDSGADRSASATSPFTDATTASQMPNASRRQAPASVHPKEGWCLWTRNASSVVEGLRAGKLLSPMSEVMRQVATRLSEEDIEAVAAYIQALH